MTMTKTLRVRAVEGIHVPFFDPVHRFVPGRFVARDEATGTALPEGATVPDDPYYRAKLRRGELTEVTGA
jgi:hypothetical protein